MLAIKLLMATPGLVGIAAVAGLSLNGHVADRFADRFADRPVASTQSAPVVAVPQPVAPSDGSPIPLRSRFTRAPDGLFYVTARVNGIKVRFLLDTGATMVVLTRADAARIGAPRATKAGSAVMETAAGSATIDRVTLDHVAIGGHQVEAVDAAVVRHGLKVSLLGQDLLSRLGPVTMSGDALELN